MESVIANPTALGAWLGHLGLLVGPNAIVHLAATPAVPHRVTWTLANGLTFAAVVRVTLTSAGARLIELGLDASMAQ